VPEGKPASKVKDVLVILLAKLLYPFGLAKPRVLFSAPVLSTPVTER
jgi:hypothetical protein